MSSTEHLVGRLAGAAGADIFWQAWLPAAGPRAVVVIAHGGGEHSGRYAQVAARLNAAGYAAYALDHRGHGRSTGRRALIDRLDNVLADLDTFVALVAAGHPGRPLYLLGHSLGGTFAIAYAVRREERLAGLLLSGPVAALEAASPALRRVARLLSVVVPTLGVYRVDPSRISRDPAVVQAYRDDPLVHHGALPVRTVAEVGTAVERFPAQVPRLRLPLLVMHGGADSIAPPSGSRMVHQRAGSPDRTLRLYDGLYHEILNEPERETVLGDVVGWLDAHGGGARS
jgi:acylglycerol lipase